jgi:hypothetical protein
MVLLNCPELDVAAPQWIAEGFSPAVLPDLTIASDRSFFNTHA